jgi:hypothetical protein
MIPNKKSYDYLQGITIKKKSSEATPLEGTNSAIKSFKQR